MALHDWATKADLVNWKSEILKWIYGGLLIQTVIVISAIIAVVHGIK